MAKKTDSKFDHFEEVSTLDEALLDEFFSLIARITLRLTAKGTKINNDIDPSSREVR
jgi:hypothetical protein